MYAELIILLAIFARFLCLSDFVINVSRNACAMSENLLARRTKKNKKTQKAQPARKYYKYMILSMWAFREVCVETTALRNTEPYSNPEQQQQQQHQQQ